MDLTTISHYDDHGRHVTSRESVYHDGAGSIVKVTVHRDRSYAFQCWAKLELFNEDQTWTTLFTANTADVHAGEAWETENKLLFSYSVFHGLQFSDFDTEAALDESGHLDDGS